MFNSTKIKANFYASDTDSESDDNYREKLKKLNNKTSEIKKQLITEIQALDQINYMSKLNFIIKKYLIVYCYFSMWDVAEIKQLLISKIDKLKLNNISFLINKVCDYTNDLFCEIRANTDCRCFSNDYLNPNLFEDNNNNNNNMRYGDSEENSVISLNGFGVLVDFTNKRLSVFFENNFYDDYAFNSSGKKYYIEDNNKDNRNINNNNNDHNSDNNNNKENDLYKDDNFININDMNTVSSLENNNNNINNMFNDNYNCVINIIKQFTSNYFSNLNDINNNLLVSLSDTVFTSKNNSNSRNSLNNNTHNNLNDINTVNTVSTVNSNINNKIKSINMTKIEFSLRIIPNAFYFKPLYKVPDFDASKFILTSDSILLLEKRLISHIQKTVRCDSLLSEAYFWFETILKTSYKIISAVKDYSPFGSATQFTHNKYSDLDICIITMDPNNNCLLNDLRDELLKKKSNSKKSSLYLSGGSDIFEIGDLYFAKNIPLFSIIYKNKIKLEISLNNCLGVYNSSMIREYCLFDSRVIMLINIVKDWSKEYRINGNYHHYLSSFCFTLLCLYFLIQKKVIPPFSYEEKNKILLSYTHHSSIVNDNDNDTESNDNDKNNKYSELGNLLIPNLIDLKRSLTKFSKTNHQTIAELFIEFLFFYGFIFNNDKYYVDIRTEEINFRYNDFDPNTNKKSFNNVFSIVDPFDLTYNPGSYFNKNFSQEKIFNNAIINTLKSIVNQEDIFSDENYNKKK